jgi:ribosomal protein S7
MPSLMLTKRGSFGANVRVPVPIRTAQLDGLQVASILSAADTAQCREEVRFGH